MTEQTFKITIKATELMEYTFVITSNRKRYPVKYIQLIKRIQSLSMDIYEYIFDANRLKLDIEAERNERLMLQTKAVSACDKLSKFIEMSMNLRLVGSDTTGDLECWYAKDEEGKVNLTPICIVN